METPAKKTAATPAKPVTTKQFFEKDAIKKKFAEVVGKRSSQYLTTVLQVINQNAMLSKAEPVSVYSAALTAATLDLPVNPNLGFAYILPYNDRKSGKTVAQFQLGYKGFIQLAQRSGQFKTISATPIYDGQVVENNPLTGIEFDFSVVPSKDSKIIGYASYFKLLNGFEKTFYMTSEEMEAHAKKFSQTYKKGFGIWKDDFSSMALKTVIKLLLSKFAPLSVETIHQAVQQDQAILDEDGSVTDYIDNNEEQSYQGFEDVTDQNELPEEGAQ